MALTQQIARRIVETLGSNGTAPEVGVQYFTVGYDRLLRVMEDEYLVDYIPNGGSAFKMVVGNYGNGKTHLMYCLRDLAWKHNFAVSYVVLGQQDGPFHDFGKVYAKVAQNINRPLEEDELLTGYERGIENFLRGTCVALLHQKMEEEPDEPRAKNELVHELKSRLRSADSSSYSNAIYEAFNALLWDKDEQFEIVCQWLKGEGHTPAHRKLNILEKIDKSTGFKMIRSLSQTVRALGYKGLVILLDEGEQVASLASKQREALLSNLREVIDACTQTSFRHIMIFYAVPDLGFMNRGGSVYEALNQRIETIYQDYVNPSGVKIELDKIIGRDEDLLPVLGQRLAEVFQVAHNIRFDAQAVARLSQTTSESALEDRYSDQGVKRLFVQRMIQGLRELRATQMEQGG
jgi:hypothetical protein